MSANAISMLSMANISAGPLCVSLRTSPMDKLFVFYVHITFDFGEWKVELPMSRIDSGLRQAGMWQAV